MLGSTRDARGFEPAAAKPDWAAFSALQASEASYDGNGRPTIKRSTSGSTTYALSQISYDAVGRGECVAQRMNDSAYGSLPSSACSLGTAGSYGDDRIVKAVYDPAGEIAQVKTAFATGIETNEMTATYSSNGRVATVTDGEGNKTTYEYDGHDRLRNTRFPSPTTDGVSAPTSGTGADFEQLTYDDNGNVTSRRLRDGATGTIQFGPQVSGQEGSLGGTASAGIVVDLKGNFGLYGTAGLMRGYGGDADATLSLEASNGNDINSLAGPFAQTSFQGGDEVAVGVDLFTDGTTSGGGFQLGGGGGAYAQTGVTGTVIVPAGIVLDGVQSALNAVGQCPRGAQ